MESLKKSIVHIKNHGYVENVLSQIIEGGAAKLQIVTDFDHTLTRSHLNGKKSITTYETLKQVYPFTTDDYKQQSKYLHDYYHPLAIDPNLSKAQKVPLMIEWYTKSIQLLPKSGITRSHVSEMVESSNICLRDGCEAMIEMLFKHNIPLLIFSAGVGDMSIEILQKNKLLLPNIEIVANFLQFDEKDRLVGFKNEMIHTFNKTPKSLKKCAFLETAKARNHLILLGDSLGDVGMADGAEGVHALLKIGFLNEKIEESLAEYMDSYDIVITDNQTMDVVMGLLQSLL